MMDKDITDPSFKYAPSQNPIDPLKTSGSAALPNTMAQQVDFVPSGDDFADTIAKQTRQRIADQTNAMNLAISKAAAGNADEAAAAQRLGYETGVGADIAARNMKALQERVAVDRIGQLDLMRADPVLAKMLSDQNFAAIAHDDVDNLQSTGTMLDSVMGVKNEFLLGRERGYATTALGKTGGKMLQDSWLGKPLLEADRAEARRQTAEMEKMRGSGGFAESFGALEGQMESGLPGQIEMAGVGAVAGGAILGLPSGGLGLVPGMVAGAELGFLSASAVQSFEIESGASFVDLLDQDIPEDTARTAATIVGTINAALEMIPLKFFTSRAKSLIKSTVQEQVVSSLVQVPGIKNAVGKFVKEWTMGIGVESVTEVVQELTNMWGEDFSKYQTDPDFQAKMTTPAGRMEVANRLLSTFEEVAKGMAVMGFIMPGANFALDAKRARKANKAKQFFKDIGKDAAASKVRERNPNSYQAWFAARAKGTGAETIYVDVDKVRGAMVKNGINQEQLQFLLPDLYKQLQAIGANSGVDVTIPTSVYAARLVDTAFGQDLQSDMRLNPDDMSINDNNEYVKTRDRRVAELVKLSDEMTASDEILAESAKVVENRVVAEIMAVGKYTELEAKAMAAAHVAFAVVNAPDFGMTPEQFDTQYGMATRGEGQVTPGATAAPAPVSAVPAVENLPRPPKPESMEQDFYDALIARAIKNVGNAGTVDLTFGVRPEGSETDMPLRVEANLRSAGNNEAADVYIEMARRVADRNIAAFQERRAAEAAAPLEQAAMPAQPSYPILAEAWNKYLDGEEYGTTNDLADTVEGLIDSDEAPQGLADALDQFREEQAYDREVGGRGDMDTANKQFESAVQAAAEQMTTPPQVLEQAARVDVITDEQSKTHEFVEGKPVTISAFHGTRTGGFTKFDPTKIDTGAAERSRFGFAPMSTDPLKGFWFTNDSEQASNRYAMLRPTKFTKEQVKDDQLVALAAALNKRIQSIESKLTEEEQKVSFDYHGSELNEVEFTADGLSDVADDKSVYYAAQEMVREYRQLFPRLANEFKLKELWSEVTGAQVERTNEVLGAQVRMENPTVEVVTDPKKFYENKKAAMDRMVANGSDGIVFVMPDGEKLYFTNNPSKINVFGSAKSTDELGALVSLSRQQVAPQVLEQAAMAEPGADSPGIGVGDEPKLGFWKPFRVKVIGDVEIPKKKLILTGTKNKNADKQLVNIDGILAKFPTAGESIEEWTKMMAYALGSDEVPIPPYAFIKGINGDGSFNTLSKLTEGQISDANHGFENAAELRAAYTSGELSVTTTAKLILWSFLSRGVSPYRQESLFIDAFNKSAEWIGMAAEGKFSEKDFPAYDKWARSAAPKGSGLPGAGATHNLNAFGKDFLFKMSKIGNNGKSHLQNLHDMLSDPNQTGQSIRREFAKIGEGVGIDNKVMSFTLLVAGFDDVMVLDRVQIRQLWDDGRFPGVNLYDGTMNEKGKKISGSSMNDITEGVRGILVYEALERQLQLKIYDLYARLGRPQDASVGRYHWETWVAFSEQEASHGTLAAVLADAKGDDQAIANVASKEGEYGAYEYGAMYNRNAEGMPGFQYQTPSGNSYSFTVSAFREFLANIKLPKNGVVPTQFKVTESANAPWYTRPEVNQQRLDEQAAKWADLAGGTGEGKRITDEIIREQNANRARSAADAVAIASQWEVPALPDGSSTLERKFYAGSSATKFARANRQQGIFDTHFSYERQTVADTEGLYRLGVPIVGEYVAGVGLAELYKRSGNATPTFYELGNTAAASERFHAAIVENKQASPFGAAVAVYTPKEYRGMRLFLSADAKSGVAVKPDGDIVSVFAANNSGRALIELAVSAGGTKLDAYDTVLAHFYAPHGFVVASRIAWDEKQVLKDWDKKTFSAFNNGEPDVVFMARDDKYMGSYKSTDGKLVTKYEDAVEIQSEAINVINEQLFQAMPSPGRRGSFDPTRLLTTLNTKADLSTFLHESSHFFFSVYTDIASRPGAPARIAADVQILLDSFGVKDIAAWNAMTFEEQRKYQEQFAYNFEIYLFEGKAPSIEMQGLFERFSKWLRRVYTSISTELNDIYRREFGEDLPILTDEIRGVMGRMLASEAQIKRAEAVNEMKPQFQTQAESGMDDARWAAYQAMIQEAHDQAVTDLTKASLRQMEWLSNARSRLLKNMQSKHDEIRKEMRAEIEAEVMAEPLYMAMSILKTGQGRAKNGELVQFNDKFKLNLEAVKKMLPSEEIVKLGYGKYGMVSEDGIPPDMVAEIVGFVSGDELVLALLTAKPAKEEIAARLDKRMMDEYGKMNTPEAREAAVQAAIHNEARERFVAVEARFIAKATQPVRVMIDAAKAAARQIVGAKKIDDISPGEYAAAEARASRDAAEAYKDRQTPDAASKSTYTRVYNEQIAKGVDEATAVAEATSKAADASTKAQGKADAYKAKYGDRTPEQVIIRAKQAQVLQNQLVKEATSSLEEVDTAVKDFRKFFGSDEKIAKSRNMDLVDAARAILSYYGFGKVDKNPADYIKKLEAYNPELYAEIAPLISQASTGVRDYTQMTMDDFRMLRDVVDALWAQSRRDKQITVAGKKIALDGVLSELDARLNEIGVPTTVPGEKSALTTKEKFAAHLYSAKALLRRVENWADATDGAGGVGAFTKYIYRPVKDAVNAYRVDRNNYVKRFVDLVSTLDLPVGKITSPELDYTFGVGNGGIGKAELLGAMLHTGNESNYKKLLIGRKWGEFNDDESVNTSRWDAFVGRMITEGVLTKEDFDFLQAVWDLNEEIKPIAQRAHRDLYGYYFKEVEATSFTNRFGTYRGGYVPAKTDAAIVRDAQRQAKAEELEADFRSSMPSTGMGFTKGRVEYNKPLSLDIRLMAKHIDDVLRFAHIQPAIKDALRIVNNRAFADKLSSIDPTAVEFMLLPWLNRTARQSTNEPGRNKVIDNFWRTLRSRTGMSIMFANLRNALQQVTGLFPSALKVSKGALKDSLFAYLASPRKTAEAIAGLSPFMNERMHSQIFEIQDQMNDLLLNPSKFDKIQKWSQHHGYFLQSAFQNFVDIVTWNGKYNQVLSEIGTTLSESEAQAEAIQQADAAVRSTQGSMSAEDVAAFEVGSPFYKTFVQFTGYFNMLANLNTDEYVKVLRDLGWRGNKGKLVSIYMLGFLAPTLVADAIARSLGAGWDDDDDGYLDDVADWFFGSQVRAGAAMVPFGSAAYTAFAAGFTARTYDDRITSSPSIGSLEASTVGVGKAVVNLASDDKELTGRNVRDVLTLITNATGVPVSVLGRPIGYQMEVNRGKVEPTDPIDYMRGLITGVPSAESKKK